MSVHVGFAVVKEALEQIFSKYFGFVYQLSFHEMLNFSHLLTGASTMDHFQSSYQGTQFNTNFRIKKTFYDVRKFKKRSLERFEIPAVVNITMMIVQDTLRHLVWYTNTNVSDSPAASIFRTIDRSNIFFRKVSTNLHGVRTSNITISIFATLRTSCLTPICNEHWVVSYMASGSILILILKVSETEINILTEASCGIFMFC
jgi:hypothetical protein